MDAGPLNGPITCLSFVPDTDLIIAGSGSHVRIINFLSGRTLVVKRLFLYQNVHGVWLRPGLSKMVFWGQKSVAVYDLIGPADTQVELRERGLLPGLRDHIWAAQLVGEWAPTSTALAPQGDKQATRTEEGVGVLVVALALNVVEVWDWRAAALLAEVRPGGSAAAARSSGGGT
eukprot:CAMPEP_0206404704 /NCGR_PEP_ID=MMETSP0294-20121207/28583_1 /ASSEMBLY_ACC=CAM_ASM_000327 /TAXON_ID=39354 /ORGANISM="Heterosigma akashiwo, Strain CCMP2393" /LENGTH=173 /DNA_ID=CAMNT_0053862765 /DNA_START=141 /DNA_END=658 /DNA_ORIENTATION=+